MSERKSLGNSWEMQHRCFDGKDKLSHFKTFALSKNYILNPSL